MPATSASVERLFSVAGQIVTAKRARLHPDTVTLLVFLHEAIPGDIERGASKELEGFGPGRRVLVINRHVCGLEPQLGKLIPY